MTTALPVIDIGPLRTGADPAPVARAIESACRDTGFFYVAGHGVPADLLARLDAAARAFFALPERVKARTGRTCGCSTAPTASTSSAR